MGSAFPNLESLEELENGILAPSLAADQPTTLDKTIVVSLRELPEEVQIFAREHDHALGRWGATHGETIARLADAPEAVVAAAVSAFAPLASFDLDPDTPGVVRLAFRGADLTRGVLGRRAGRSRRQRRSLVALLEAR